MAALGGERAKPAAVAQAALSRQLALVRRRLARHRSKISRCDESSKV
jgi:hypothetical protein